MASFTVCLTHDVDRVFKTYQYITRDVRQGNWRGLRTLFTSETPYWRFEQLMEFEDRFGAKSTFFFLSESIPFNPFRPKDWKLSLGRYRYSHPRIAAIIQALDKGGWEIGVHGSYNSYRSLELLQREKKELEDVVGRNVVGIRQHYLNLDVPQTWILQREAGFRYDASLGIRGGIGFPEKRYRPFVDESSGMFVIPLTLMEGYLFRVAKNDVSRARQLMMDIIDEAEANQAVLTALWHPHRVNDAEFPGVGTAYELLVQECHKRGA